MVRIVLDPLLVAFVLAVPGRPVTGKAVTEDALDEEEDDGEDAGSKFLGPQRLKLIVGVHPPVRKLTFRYYFEKFGAVEFAGAP
ncbi:MAG: hypothetical protein AB7F89_17370 [Pirellulaceae bacterium]